jgi:hypothetical protein
MRPSLSDMPHVTMGETTIPRGSHDYEQCCGRINTVIRTIGLIGFVEGENATIYCWGDNQFR